MIWFPRVYNLSLIRSKSFAACTILLAFTVVSQLRKSRTKTKAQMVVLASAIFDNDGRLLVTTEGQLPNIKITKQYIEHVGQGLKF